MTEQGYTPGKVFTNGNTVIYSKEGDDILAVADEFCIPTDIAKANALRLAACWNACQNIPTEAIEQGVVAELIEACEESLGDYEYQERETGIESNALKLLRAALTKAQVQSRNTRQ